MSGTGNDFCVGFPPEVKVVERMLYTQIPEEERVPFMSFLGTNYTLNRSGEPVFLKEKYEQWKQSQ